MFRYVPWRTVSPTQVPDATPAPTVTATFPATTPDLRSPETAVPRSDGMVGQTEMIALVAVIAGLIVVAIVLSIVIALIRKNRKQIYPENDFEAKPTSTFTVKNIYSVNTVQA
jgi:hypothetical protein